MNDQESTKFLIEELDPKRINELYEIVIESRKEFFATGMIPKFDMTINDLQGIVDDSLEQMKSKTGYFFTVVDGAINQIVGVSFLNSINRYHLFANLGYMIRTSRTGQGIATKAARLVAQYGFEKLGLQRIEIVSSIDNEPSLRVAEELGAAREGLQRNRVLIHGTPHDAYMHSLIPKDFGIDNSSVPSDGPIQ